jgi:hypothetical protein
MQAPDAQKLQIVTIPVRDGEVKRMQVIALDGVGSIMAAQGK